MNEDDAKITAAEGARRLHVLQLPDNEDLTAHEPRHASPADDADRDEHDA